ncbi:hypothetical protein LAJLEIBI_03036 [[Clostridium] hylemonae DSM 15053]|nr:hypothetical protein LAJLEIBI_03036 [[Clostridium] hylemonae DSM 15053]
MDAMMHEKKEEKYEKDDKSNRMSHNDGGIDAGRLFRRQQQRQKRRRKTEAGIPQVSLKFATEPYPDHTVPYVGIEKSF